MEARAVLRGIRAPEEELLGDPAVCIAVLDGPVDSIRWEMLRDGIEDYEYLALLARLLDARASGLTHAERRRYRALLEVPETIARDMTTFTKDPRPIEDRRHEIARAIEALTGQ